MTPTLRTRLAFGLAACLIAVSGCAPADPDGESRTFEFPDPTHGGTTIILTLIRQE